MVLSYGDFVIIYSFTPKTVIYFFSHQKKKKKKHTLTEGGRKAGFVNILLKYKIHKVEDSSHSSTVNP